MIDLYGTGSPNVLKVAIMLEEIGQPYRGHHVRIMHNENLTPSFLALTPIGKVPVIVDHQGIAAGLPIFESGAILIYLAEAYGSGLLPATGAARWQTLEWLMVQMSSAGPMLGQVNHFQLIPSEADSYAARRYRDQAARIYRQIDARLMLFPWLAGAEYSIADIAMYPWAAYLNRHGFESGDFPGLIAWRDRIDRRPAVKRAVAALESMMAADPEVARPATDEQIDRLFNRSKGGPAADFGRYFALGPMTTAKP